LDSRRFRRVRVHAPLYIAANGKFIQKKIKLESTDVSGGGVSFETSQKIPLEADSRLVLSDLGDLPPGSLIEGRIVRTEEGSEPGRHKVAIEFVRFVNVTREELLKRIELWEAQAPLADMD